MGTTGGNRAKILEDVRASGTYAVISPNMGKQASRQWGCLDCLGAGLGQGPVRHGHGGVHGGWTAVRPRAVSFPSPDPRTALSPAPLSLKQQTPSFEQIVALQTMLELMAERFPGCLAGYTLKVVESHQATKADASGTAIANVNSFRGMGVDFDVARTIVGLQGQWLRLCLGRRACVWVGARGARTQGAGLR